MAYVPIPKEGRTLALVVRHGRTASNEGRPKLRAWDDLPLNRDGELDADLAANTLRPFAPKIIYSSDLIRDTQTAHRISEILKIPAEIAFELRTADMGEWTGMYTDELADEIRNWYERPFMAAPGGESQDNFLGRLFPWVDSKLILFRDVPQYRPGVFVTHGRPVAALDSRYNFRPPIEGRMSKPGGVSEIKEMPLRRIAFDFLGPTEDLIEDA